MEGLFQQNVYDYATKGFCYFYENHIPLLLLFIIMKGF